jgi:hypothetical protein
VNPDIAELLASGKPIAELAEANDHSWFPEWQGYFSNREGLAYALAAEDRTVLEIGSWKGRSTMFAAATAEKIYAVDTWRGDDYAGRGWFFPEFEANCREQIIAGKIVPVMCDFRDALVREYAWHAQTVLYDADHAASAIAQAADVLLSGDWYRLLIHDCDYAAEESLIRSVAKTVEGRVTYADRLAVIAAADDPIHDRLEARPW